VLSLSRSMARAAQAVRPGDLPASVVDKVKIGLLDMLSCALETQAAPRPFNTGSSGEAAFINATRAHGLVREDMHTGSVSHLGVVIYPTLLALSQRQPVCGREFIRAAVCGYEIGAAIGKALVDREFAKFHRPTGTTGPIAGAAAGSLLLGLSEDQMVSAIGFGANTASGLNEWPYCGGDEMFFHPGFAARNAVTSVELAAWGAVASETALDGRAGLFASFGRSTVAVTPFEAGRWEILSVYYKPAPACNYAQTACQAALAVADAKDIERILVRCSAAAVAYPGCDFAGPYERLLQAKMSIQYCVAATLAHREIAESNYKRLDAPEVMQLVSVMTLEEGEEFTARYPAKQGAEVTLFLRNGETRTCTMEDVVPASPEEIRARFRAVCGNAEAVEAFVDTLESQDDAGALARLLKED
jgi:2-methylcitrate dehydratase PrpD